MYKKKSQLILLHFAGGSKYSYDFLKKYFKNTNIEIHALELPGRGKRYQEDFVKDKEAAINDYIHQIKQLRNNQPYLIFGHSMGATLGLTITKRMEEIGDIPISLIVSGNPGPGIKEYAGNEKRYLMNDVDFKEEGRELGGVPEEVLTNEELYSFFEPIMRADFRVLENDEFSEKNTKLKTPILAIMGDEEMMNTKINNWNTFTTGNFRSKIFKGNHFFIPDNAKQLADLIISQSLVVY